MDLRRQLSILRHWSWVLIASVLIAGGAAWFGSGLMTKVYEGRATVIVGQSLTSTNPDYNELLTSQRLTETYAAVATTRPLLEKVIAGLQLEMSPDELAGKIAVQTPQDSTLLHIVATDPDPARAAAIANQVSQELLAASPAIQGRASEVTQFVDRDLRAVQDQIQEAQAEVERLTAITDRSDQEQQALETTQGRLVTLRSTYATLLSFSTSSSANLLTVVEPAIAPAEPASPRPLLNTILAAIAGLMLAAVVVSLIEHHDDTLKSAEDVQAATGLTTLGAIARMKGDDRRSEIYRLATLLYPRSPIDEAYRTLRTNIDFSRIDRPMSVLLVTSSVPGEGKTTTAANLAVVYAQAGRRTLLVDADMRKPGVHRIFNLQNTGGLSDLFRPESVPLATLVRRTEQERLDVLTSGPLPPNPAELLASRRWETILEELRRSWDLVIIDSPPLQAVTDAAILSAVADGTLFVIDAGRTRRGAVIRGREALEKAGARVLGVVVNRLTQRVQGGYYYYYDYYGDKPAGGKGRSDAGGGRTATPVPASAERK